MASMSIWSTSFSSSRIFAGESGCVVSMSPPCGASSARDGGVQRRDPGRPLCGRGEAAGPGAATGARVEVDDDAAGADLADGGDQLDRVAGGDASGPRVLDVEAADDVARLLVG